ncbi:MAG TPA: IS66 family transposase [Streptosporangiaceae bacterium]
MTAAEWPTLEQLRQENQALRTQVAALEQTVRDLLDQNRQLQEKLDEQARAAARQAAPFRRRQSQKVPEGSRKRPGRPPGHPGVHRAVPGHVDDHVNVPLTGCPHCGGPVTAVEAIEQFIEEIPPVRPHVTHRVTYRGCCATCGEVHSAHPLQTSTATGAARTQLGPRARALAAALNKQFGLTMRKTCRVLQLVAGLALSPGGLAQAVQRTAARVQPAFDSLVTEVRAAAAVFADETSWYVGAPGYWLWTFTTADATVYHVDSSRGRQVVLDTLGEDFAGILVSDCLASYENLPYRMHKCIGHHQKAIAEARGRPDTKDPGYLNEWKLLLTMVNALWKHRADLGAEEFARQRGHLEAWLDRLLAEPRAQPGDVAIQQRIGKRRGVVLGCLDDPAAEPTNNRAERSLRDPGVIARKVSCGNKTEAGKAAWERLTSLAMTCQQRGHDFVSWLAACLPLDAPVTPVPAATPAR